MNYQNLHVSVFVNKVLELLQIKPNGNYLDCTFGRGGHSFEIIKRLESKGFLWTIDCDITAVNFYKEKFNYKNSIIIHDFFDNLEVISKNSKFNNLDGILYDLGLSSPQLDESTRGFSYHGSDQLDMRMNQNQKFSAKELLENYSKEELNEIFFKYGEIKKPQYVTNAIIKARKVKPITLTSELVNIIKLNVHPKQLYQKKHPARQYFQAIRIAVNNELFRIEKSLHAASKLLKKNGRIIVLTFHSLEEKVVKKVFSDLSSNKIPNEVPIMHPEKNFQIIRVKEKLNEVEQIKNFRSRSAKIWCLEKL